jgi:hypothetical protein
MTMSEDPWDGTLNHREAVRRALAVSFVALTGALGCGRHSPPAPLDPSLAASPSPSPTVAPAIVGCGLPSGGGSGEGCPLESPSYGDAVERAIDQAVAEHPEMVNTARARGCFNCFQVLDTHNFPEEVGRNLERMGFCTRYDGEELAVKRVNAFNDQYDILLSEGYIRRADRGSYRSTCYPAWF